MKFSDLVVFRKDLLFNGAVQLGWLENNRPLVDTVAEYFVFHGPEYHGVSEADFKDSGHRLVDTATFTKDVIEGIAGNADEPFTLAIAGYGTGKSHLAVTLSCLLDNPTAPIAKKILNNLERADKTIGQSVRRTLTSLNQPYLVVAVNGMQDFDLTNEIVRQVLSRLRSHGCDTGPLENLRPRFRSAINFTESFFDSLVDEFRAAFLEYDCASVVERLQSMDEDVFTKVSDIYEQKMGSPIHSVGRESLEDFIRVAKDTYCGPGREFAGILIIFDEFGRYMEFSVQKPHVAGPGALQQLFESVQGNGDRVFLLGLIQYELKAYISRVAPELRDDLSRYITRYDSIKKVRLSTNLETVIANLLEKKELEVLTEYASSDLGLRQSLLKWFPDMENHAVWTDSKRFQKIISEGCWPLHPCSSWLLYKLSSVGKSLQQRSALSLLAEVYDHWADRKAVEGSRINAIDLCTQSLIDEFLSAEQYGKYGATAHAYEMVVQKYGYELTVNESVALKAVLLCSKIGCKTSSLEDCLDLLGTLGGLNPIECGQAVRSLEHDYNVLEWNERLHQYEIISDAAPKKAFVAYLRSKVAEVTYEQRAQIFAQKYMSWSEKKEYPTDFGSKHKITTREWNYNLSFTDVVTLKNQIQFAFRSWRDAINVDQFKGQLIYCYLGPESKLEVVKVVAESEFEKMFINLKIDSGAGAPVGVLYLHDDNGSFGEKLAEYWVLNEMTGEEAQKYANFIADKQNTLLQEITNQFSELERKRLLSIATKRPVSGSRLKPILENVFAAIYDQVIPFPFDGFHTAAGNAAKDCQMFTRELFMGTLDRDAIANKTAQQRNRGFEVLDKSWGFIDASGSVRPKPQNPAVRRLIELMDERLSGDSEETRTLNLGEVLRLLCAPPYGLNIASAGLIMGAFFGKRKNRLNLVLRGNPRNVNEWLNEALPNRFLDRGVLDNTEIIMVTADSVSEWENLLADWDVETTYLGKIEFRKKAADQAKRVPIPHELRYRLELFEEKASQAENHLRQFSYQVGEAQDLIERGNGSDVGNISRGAAALLAIYNRMKADNQCWRNNQIEQIEKYIADARIVIQQVFKQWLNSQRLTRIEKLGEFHHRMLKIGSNLDLLGFPNEADELRKHMEEAENRARFIAKLKQTTDDIDNMIRISQVTNSTPVSLLNTWIDKVHELKKMLDEAVKVTYIVAEDVRSSNQKLAHFKAQCTEQLERNKKRISAVYNIASITSLSEIANWRAEIAQIIEIYQGNETDVGDLKLVQIQLDKIETHLKLLDNYNMNNEYWAALYAKCFDEAEGLFEDDVPPLDNEVIYGGIKKVIQAKRESIAEDWMQRSVPTGKQINAFNASQANQCLQTLNKMPSVLSPQQVNNVNAAISACEKRLDELEVEGVLAKFNSLSESNKRAFVELISQYLKEYSIYSP